MSESLSSTVVSETAPSLIHSTPAPSSITGQTLYNLSSAHFIQQVNSAFKNYHSILTLSRSPLANSDLVTPALVLDNVSPTADERGHALRLILQWAVERLAPDAIQHPLGNYRPLDDPTWRDPRWWHYNILRHRYLEPLHPDDFVEGGRFTETLIALTGIPSTDTFFDERNRAIREVTQRLQQQLANRSEHDALQRMALERACLPLSSQPAEFALLGIAATFEDVFPRTLLLEMATHEQLATIDPVLDNLILQRFLLTGDERRNLWLSPVLQAYIYERQSKNNLNRRHQKAAQFYFNEGDPLKAAEHWIAAEQWSKAANILVETSNDLINELQLGELTVTLLRFKVAQLPSEQWVEVQLLLSDLFNRSGQQEEALVACRQALKVADNPNQQARIYRRMGKLYEKHNQFHALGYYQKAVERFSPTSPELVNLLKDRGWLYILRREWPKAENDLTFALAHVPDSANETRADIYDALATLYRYQKQYDLSIEHAHSALTLREESGNLPRVADSFNNLGLIYNDMGEYAQAIAAFEEAMVTYERLRNRELIATALLNIGMAHHLNTMLPEAVEAYKKSLQICEEIGLPLVEVKAHSNLAEGLAELERIEEAHYHWQKGYTLSKQAGFEGQITYFEELRTQIPTLEATTKQEMENSPEGNEQPTDTKQLIGQEDHFIIESTRRDGRITPKTLMEAAHISKATATRRLANLVEQGYLEKRGKGRGTHYVLVEQLQAQITANQSSQAQQKSELEQIARKLSEHQQSLNQQYAIDALGIDDPTSNRQNRRPKIDLMVRFTELPNLQQFFELENHLSTLVDANINLFVEGCPSPTWREQARNDIAWIW